MPLLVVPACVPELDEHLVVAELLARPPDVVERALLPDDVRGELEQDPAQLSLRPERAECRQEALEHLAAELAGRPVDAAFLVGRRLVAQVGRQRLELHRMARHQAEGLDVHHEPIGRPLGPALHHRIHGQAVVRRVDLDGVEVLRVVREPFGGRCFGRIEVLREGVVRPRARPDPDLRHGSQDTRRGPCEPRLSDRSCAPARAERGSSGCWP